MPRVQTLTSLVVLALAWFGCESTPTATGPASEPLTPSGAEREVAVRPSSDEDVDDLDELAYLDAQLDPTKILDQTRAEAEQCDAGDARQCRVLANRYEEGIGAPEDRGRAIALYRRGCDQGLGYHCLLGGWLSTASKDPGELAAGVELHHQACELEHLHGCVAAAAVLTSSDGSAEGIAGLRAKACRGGYRIACDDGVEPVPNSSPSSAEAACPASFHSSTSQSGGPRLHGTLEQLDHQALLATIPDVVPEFTTERRSSTPAGRAGTRTSVASAEFVGGDSRVSVTIIDRAPDCTLQPGTGRAMVALTVDQRGGRALEVGGSPAVILDPKPTTDESPTTRNLTVWVADRCEVIWSAAELPELELIAVTKRVDWIGLAELCQQRPGDSR